MTPRRIKMEGGGKTVYAHKGDTIHFYDDVDKQKRSGEFVKRVTKGGRQYAHVRMADKDVHLPIHHIDAINESQVVVESEDVHGGFEKMGFKRDIDNDGYGMTHHKARGVDFSRVHDHLVKHGYVHDSSDEHEPQANYHYYNHPNGSSFSIAANKKNTRVTTGLYNKNND